MPFESLYYNFTKKKLHMAQCVYKYGLRHYSRISLSSSHFTAAIPNAVVHSIQQKKRYVEQTTQRTMVVMGRRRSSSCQQMSEETRRKISEDKRNFRKQKFIIVIQNRKMLFFLFNCYCCKLSSTVYKKMKGNFWFIQIRSLLIQQIGGLDSYLESFLTI